MSSARSRAQCFARCVKSGDAALEKTGWKACKPQFSGVIQAEALLPCSAVYPLAYITACLYLGNDLRSLACSVAALVPCIYPSQGTSPSLRASLSPFFFRPQRTHSLVDHPDLFLRYVTWTCSCSWRALRLKLPCAVGCTRCRAIPTLSSTPTSQRTATLALHHRCIAFYFVPSHASRPR